MTRATVALALALAACVGSPLPVTPDAGPIALPCPAPTAPDLAQLPAVDMAQAPAVDLATLPAPWFGPSPGVRDKVLPFGDSITWGWLSTTVNPGGGYRPSMAQTLVAAGRSIDFVGSQTSTLAGFTDRANEGHPSWTCADLETITDATLAEYKPSVVTLMCGTNDIRLGLDALANMIKLVDRILTHCDGSTCKLLLVTPPPYIDTPAHQTAMETLQVAMQARTWPVGVGLTGPILQTGDLDSGGIHPTPDGYARLGLALGTWLTVIQ